MTFKGILLASVLALGVATRVTARESVSAPDSLLVYYTDGVRLAAEGEKQQALALLERAIALAPDHDPSLFEAANVLASLGQLQRALDYSSRAVEADPANRWYTALKGRILLSLERFDEALPIFRALASGTGEVDPDNFRMLAFLYHQAGRTDDALGTIDEAEVRLGPSSELVELRRNILIGADRLDEAAEVTRRYLARAPYDEDNRLALAEMYDYMGRDSLQTETLKEVVAINPDNAAALASLADLYLGRGSEKLYFATLRQLFTLEGVPLGEKTTHFEKLARSTSFYRKHFMEMGDLALILLSRYPARTEVVELYADHAVRSGDAAGALAILKTQLGAPSPALSTFTKTIELEAYLKRADSVALYCDRALGLYPREHRIYTLRAGALQYMGRPKEALRTLDRALKVADTDSLRSEIHGARGSLWHEAGNNRRTFAEYEKALGYNPANALVLNNWAYYLAEEGRDLDRALGMASRAIRLQENFATYLDTYAWVLYKSGDLAGAKKAMQQALPLDRDGSSELLFHYGEILWALGDEYMASTYWKRAREAGYEPSLAIEERLARIK